MYGINWLQLISGLLLILSVGYYIYVLIHTKDERRFDYIFGRSSQLTFLTFILGIAIVLIRANASDVSASTLSDWFIVMGAAVGVVNMISLFYYQKRDKKQSK